MSEKPDSYEAKYSELEQIINSLQSPDTDLDGAMSKYEEGMKLISELESYLKQAENKITKIKAAKTK